MSGPVAPENRWGFTVEPGTIRVSRRHASGPHRWSAWSVLVDDEELATLHNGHAVDLPIAAGPHRVLIRVHSSTSQALELQVEPGRTRSIECGPDGATELAWMEAERKASGRRPETIDPEPIARIEAHLTD